jgi:hypothetical protein
VSPTSTISPTHTVSPTVTQTFTPVPFLASAAGLPPVVLGPSPAKKGQPICLYTQQGVVSSTWTVYNSGNQKVSTLTFGSEAQQCCATDTLAPGMYYVSIKVTLADGSTVTKSLKVAILP